VAVPHGPDPAEPPPQETAIGRNERHHDFLAETRPPGLSHVPSPIDDSIGARRPAGTISSSEQGVFGTGQLAAAPRCHEADERLVDLALDGLQPLHILGLRTASAKLGTYSQWTARTAQIEPGTTELEFYDYEIPDGIQELTSTPHDPRAQVMLNLLFDRLLTNELRARLPGGLALVQDISRDEYLLLVEQVLNPDMSSSAHDQLRSIGYGREF